MNLSRDGGLRLQINVCTLVCNWGKGESVAQEMGWEERNGKRYYYRKRREDGQVVSEYWGSEYLAELSAHLDALEQDRKATARAEWRRYQAEQAALDGEIAKFAELVQTLTAVVLLVSGCHRPKRQWRVKREQG